jgi:hypothetical protein
MVKSWAGRIDTPENAATAKDEKAGLSGQPLNATLKSDLAPAEHRAPKNQLVRL